MEPRPWKREEIPSGLLSFSRGRATRGTPCFVLFFARIAALTVRSAKFIEVKLRKQAKYEPIYHNIELRNIHVATNCVSAAGALRGRLRPKCALFCFFLPLYLPHQWESLVQDQQGRCEMSSVFSWDTPGILHPFFSFSSLLPQPVLNIYEGSLELILQLTKIPDRLSQHIRPQKPLNLVLSRIYRDQMVWSGVWEHLSSWLSLNLTCITSVIRSELNEKYYFASDICTKSRSVNRLCFSFTLPSSQFLFSALPSFPPFAIFFSPHLYPVFPPFLCPR